MLWVFVFDDSESREAEEVRAALDSLGDSALLWVALRDPTEDELAVVQEAFELSDEQVQRLVEPP